MLSSKKQPNFVGFFLKSEKRYRFSLLKIALLNGTTSKCWLADDTIFRLTFSFLQVNQITLNSWKLSELAPSILNNLLTQFGPAQLSMWVLSALYLGNSCSAPPNPQLIQIFIFILMCWSFFIQRQLFSTLVFFCFSVYVCFVSEWNREDFGNQFRCTVMLFKGVWE